MSPNEPWLPHGTYAASAGLFVAILAVVGCVGAATLPGRAATAVAAASGAFAVVPATIALVFLLRGRRHLARVGRLLDGPALARFTYDDATWQRQVARLSRNRRPLESLLGAAVGLSGLVIGLLLLGDGTRIAGSPIHTLALPTVGGVAVGGFVGFVVRRTGDVLVRRMAEGPGIACVGEDGLYVTGQYWPWTEIGARFCGVTLRREGEEALLVFRFLLRNDGNTPGLDVPVPVPPGEEEAAFAVIRALDPA